MDAKGARARDTTWLASQVEVTERDMLDVGAWEIVETEKRARPGTVSEAILWGTTLTSASLVLRTGFTNTLLLGGPKR